MLTVRPSSALNSLTQPTRTLQSTNLTGLAQVRKINLLRLSPNLNSLLLFKITKNPSPSLPGMMSFTPPVIFPIWGFYCDICDCHILPARAWTPALMSAPTHALSRKVLGLSKPKDKIYKMKNDNIKKILLQLYNIWNKKKFRGASSGKYKGYCTCTILCLFSFFFFWFGSYLL